MTKTIAIGADHAGFELKALVVAHLNAKGWATVDYGTHSLESVDYPDFAHPVAYALTNGSAELGIVICGSGNGVAIAVNRHPHVRCALCWLPELATLARTHNDANVISLPARFITSEVALEIVDAFISQDFEGGRHTRRRDKIEIQP